MELAGRRCIVTGGGRGIGRAIALALAEEGARVALVARTRAELDATAPKERCDHGATLLNFIFGNRERLSLKVMNES